MTESIGIYIVEDNRLFREGLVFMLAEIEDLAVVGSSDNGQEAMEQIKSLDPALALIDISLPDDEGIYLTESLRREKPNVKVIIIGIPNLSDEVMSCIEAGAVGYVLKEASFDYLIQTIRAAIRGESFITPRMASFLFIRMAELSADKTEQNSIQLTPREVEIINEIAVGLTNKEIAQQLFIEVQTVKNHVHNILDKLQLHNRLEAVQYARTRHLLK